MKYLVILIGLLVVVLCVVGYLLVNLAREYRSLEKRASKMSMDYYQLLYTNCVMEDKLERIKNISSESDVERLQWINNITKETE